MRMFRIRASFINRSELELRQCGDEQQKTFANCNFILHFDFVAAFVALRRRMTLRTGSSSVGTAHYTDKRLRLPSQEGRGRAHASAQRSSGNLTAHSEHTRTAEPSLGRANPPFAVEAEKPAKHRGSQPRPRAAALHGTAAGGGMATQPHVNLRSRDSRTDATVTSRRVGAVE
jgi:hypothetical protein